MTNPSHPGWVKVGFTVRSVEERRAELSGSTGVKDDFKVLHIFRVEAGTGAVAERVAHRALKAFQRKKEFFRCDPTEAIKLISAALSSPGFSVETKRLEAAKAWAQKRQAQEGLARYARERNVAATDYSREHGRIRAKLSKELAVRIWGPRLCYWAICAIGVYVVKSNLGNGWAIALCSVAVFGWVPVADIWTSLERQPEYRKAMAVVEQRYKEVLQSIDSRERADDLQGVAAASTEELRVATSSLRNMGASTWFSPPSKRRGKRRR